MFRKISVFILIAAAVAVTASAQTPEAKADKAVRSFALTMGSDGGYLGVQTSEVSKENFSKFGLREVCGVAVDKVMENSPASTAGLMAGDVIVRFENEEITSVRKLTRLIGEVAPDHQVKIAIMRNGSEQTLTATLGKRQMPGFGNGNFTFSTPAPLATIDLEKLKNLEDLKDLPEGGVARTFSMPNGEGRVFMTRAGSSRQIGVGVISLTKQLATRYGVEGGVLISEVREGSPASKAGLMAGDIIVEADGKALKGEFDLIRTIGEKKEGDVNLTVIRDGKRQNISVTPEPAKNNGFVFETNDENGLTTIAPASGKTFRSMTPIAPMAPIAPASLFVRPGRIL